MTQENSLLPTGTTAPVVKRCGCGASYTQAGFDLLHYVGRHDYEEEGDKRLVLRNCTCGSTIAMDLPQ